MTTPEEIITCPYNKAHSIILNRMQFHLARCRVQHPHAEKTICPFNSTHIVNKIELDIHQRICEDRIVLDSFSYKVGGSSRPRLTTNVDEEVNFDESWDDELLTNESVLENVKKDSLNKPTFTVLIGAAKSERKAHRHDERLRIQRVLDMKRNLEKNKNKEIKEEKKNNSKEISHGKEINGKHDNNVGESMNQADSIVNKEGSNFRKENTKQDKRMDVSEKKRVIVLQYPKAPEQEKTLSKPTEKSKDDKRMNILERNRVVVLQHPKAREHEESCSKPTEKNVDTEKSVDLNTFKERKVSSYADVTSCITSQNNIVPTHAEKMEKAKEDKKLNFSEIIRVVALQDPKTPECEKSCNKLTEKAKDSKGLVKSEIKHVAASQDPKAPGSERFCNELIVPQFQKNPELNKIKNSLGTLKIDTTPKLYVPPKMLDINGNDVKRNPFSPWKTIKKTPWPSSVFGEEDDFPALPAIGRARGRPT